MIKIQNKEDCCGCGACAIICNHKAITMTPDNLGFKYPIVNNELCTNCGLCTQVCSFKKDYVISCNLKTPIVLAARHKNIKELEQSRSGATFAALSDFILAKGGIVYGAGFGNNFKVIHKRAQTREERNELRGSKYVQSDMKDTFIYIKKDLKEGKEVLFSGTPCQTAALKSYLNKDYDNLYLADIICHGTSSPQIWDDYLKFIKRIAFNNIRSVNFRDKQLFGWSSHQESFTFGNNEKKRIFPFKFYNDFSLRPSCYSCYFANTTRPSDITLGDFWGWEKSVPEFNKDNKGISLLLINTEKGKALFENIKEMMNYKIITLNEAMQPNLQRPTPIPAKHDHYINNYIKYGYFITALKYKQIKLSSVIKNLIKSFR